MIIQVRAKEVLEGEKGGPGSGNFNHAGVEGQRGGSAPSKGGTGLDRVWTDAYGVETVGQWLERHDIPVNPDGTVTLYHARPKKGSRKYTTLREGSYVIQDPAKAAHYAARDRGLDPDKDIQVLELRLDPNDIEPGMFITLRREIHIK